MRRIAAALLVPLAACLVLVGCGSSSAPSAANANAAVKVTGVLGKTANVSIPAAMASSKLAISTPIKGTGPALKSGDSSLADVMLYKWSGTKHALLSSSFTSGGPSIIPAQVGLPGLVTALKGAHLGSRIVAVLPPKYGYGPSGNSQLQVTGSDTLVWVIDLLQQYSATQSATGSQVSTGGGNLPSVSAKPGQAPVVTVPKNSPPSKLSVTTLIQGSGPKLAKGDIAVAQYVGVNWRTGKAFDASWPSAQNPAGHLLSFPVGGQQVLPGLSNGLAGVPVGSRVMVVIPPALGYGPAGGQASAGIKKTDTLVFVIDVLGSQPTA
ncbi:MAG TPA: FKBP-type peptidyl-prolyl cis-trans isomerase [Streptosporangiaceae bacterium]|nr:FKBP-type peptidyl-prolyl cis-trans isomerase [Streptosporangiaceae bacterium]